MNDLKLYVKTEQLLYKVYPMLDTNDYIYQDNKGSLKVKKEVL